MTPDPTTPESLMLQQLQDAAPGMNGNGHQPDPGPDDEVEPLWLADGHRMTDVGNASRLAHLASENIRYVPKWKTWLVYSGGVWHLDDGDARVTEIAKRVPRYLFKLAAGIYGDKDRRERAWKWATRSESAGAIRAMVTLARAIPGIIVEHTDLDKHPWLLNVANGTIDLRTGQLLDHNPEHLLTKQAPVIYDPRATCPLWEQCLATWQPDETIRSYLQRVTGSGATGHPLEHLFLNYGSGGNGKGKFYGAIEHVLGPYVVIPDKSLFVVQRHEPHPTVKASLFGARLLLAPETDHGDRLAEAAVKELTGADPITARRMHENEWKFRPTWTAFLHTNHKPTIRGTDEGVWRRLRLIPWTTTIPEDQRDLQLAAKLEAEASGILNWLIAGAHAFHEHGLDEPETVTEATAAYRQDQDQLGRFLDDCCTIGPGRYIMADKLRSRYEQWCQAEGETPLSAKTVGVELRTRGVEKPRSGRPRWVGIALLADVDTEEAKTP